MTQGRKPKPTRLKVIQGNPGRRALNEAEPNPVGDLEAPPEWLTDAQKEGWHYALANAPLSMLKRIDRTVLVTWVVAEDIYRTAAQMQARLDARPLAYPLVDKTGTGAKVQSPYLSILNRQALILLKAAAELGFTPSSRSRITLDASSTEDPDARDLFGF